MWTGAEEDQLQLVTVLVKVLEKRQGGMAALGSRGGLEGMMHDKVFFCFFKSLGPGGVLESCICKIEGNV